MQKFETHIGIGALLRATNVDTDQIIPARYLKSVKRTGFQDGLFSNWREDPNFVLNKPEFKSATVLFAGADFGTGSSREHASWALKDYGFRAVFSPRFADIFRGNAGKNGLLAGLMEEADIRRIWELLEAGKTDVMVDLNARTVLVAGVEFAFDIDDYTRWRLMEGLDDIGLTLRQEAMIAEFENQRPAFKPQV